MYDDHNYINKNLVVTKKGFSIKIWSKGVSILSMRCLSDQVTASENASPHPLSVKIDNPATVECNTMNAFVERLYKSVHHYLILYNLLCLTPFCGGGRFVPLCRHSRQQ